MNSGQRDDVPARGLQCESLGSDPLRAAPCATTRSKLSEPLASAATRSVTWTAEALELYEVDCGHYPDRLEALWGRPAGALTWGPVQYLEEHPPKDPWGNEYQYFPPVDGRPFVLVSLGADGAPGGTDECFDLSSRTILTWGR